MKRMHNVSSERFQLPLPDWDSLSAYSSISLNNTNIENVEVFTYLGSKVNISSCSDEVNTRIGKAQHAFNRLRKQLWERNEVSLNTKMRIYSSLVLSVLLYCGETWTLLARDLAKLEVFHMNWLRNKIRVSRRQRQRNEILLKCKQNQNLAVLSKSD